MAKKPKPRAGKSRTRKPLTAKKQIIESNRGLLEQVQAIANSMQENHRGLEERVAKSNQQLWDNQQKQGQGLDASQEHIMLIRRVLHDAFSGVTRYEILERPPFPGAEKTEENAELWQAQVIDWGWYADQLRFQADKNAFMAGCTISDEDLDVRRGKAETQRCTNIVQALAYKAIQKDEKEVVKALDDIEALRPLLTDHLPTAAGKWTDEMEAMAYDHTKTVLGQVRQRRAMAVLPPLLKKLIEDNETGLRKESKLSDPSDDFVEAMKLAVTNDGKQMADWEDDLAVKAHMMLKAQLSALDKKRQDQRESDIGDALERLGKTCSAMALEDIGQRVLEGENILKTKKGVEIEMDAADRKAAYVTIKHILDEKAKKIDPDANPEAVEEATAELMAEFKDMGELAARTQKAIEDGDEAAAQAGMAELKRRADEKEAEGIEDPHPELPKGATVFGG